MHSSQRALWHLYPRASPLFHPEGEGCGKIFCALAGPVDWQAFIAMHMGSETGSPRIPKRTKKGRTTWGILIWSLYFFIGKFLYFNQEAIVMSCWEGSLYGPSGDRCPTNHCDFYSSPSLSSSCSPSPFWVNHPLKNVSYLYYKHSLGVLSTLTPSTPLPCSLFHPPFIFQKLTRNPPFQCFGPEVLTFHWTQVFGGRCSEIQALFVVGENLSEIHTGQELRQFKKMKRIRQETKWGAERKWMNYEVLNKTEGKVSKRLQIQVFR